MWPAFLVRTPGRAHRRLKRHWCTQPLQNSGACGQAWCVWSGIHGSRSTLTLRCFHTACLQTLSGMSTPPQRSIPKSPRLRPPSRTELGTGFAMHLRRTPQLFTVRAGRQSLSGVLSPGCSKQGSPPAAQHYEIASFEAAIPHGSLHGSYLEPGQQPDPDPCPSRRRRGRWDIFEPEGRPRATHTARGCRRRSLRAAPPRH